MAYDAAYFEGTDGGGYDFESAFARAHDDARFVSEIELLEARGLNGSVLDIGCATGRFLRFAQDRGWEIAGVELSNFARQKATETLSISVGRDISHLPQGRAYDVVTLHHVLEHVEDPKTFLRDEVRPRVRRRLLIEVPNFASLASRAQGPAWRDLRPEQHRFHFTRETLSRVVQEAGFRVVEVYTLWPPLWTLRTALETVLLMKALAPHGEHDGMTEPPWMKREKEAFYVEPRGWKRWGARVSWWAFRPLVRVLERAGLGERLVLEAEPLPT